MTKICSKCRTSKSLQGFYRRKKGPRSGEYYKKCRDCMKSRGRKYYHDNKERQLPLAIKRTKKARLQKKKYVDSLKKVPCQDCGVRHPPVVMDFDHRNADDKIVEVAKAVATNWSLDRILDEVEKCDVVCSNCHRLRTYMNMPS